MVDFGVELDVGGEATPEGLVRPGGEAERELALEHEDRDAGEGPRREELEDDGGRDLVRRVADADVEVGEGHLAEVAEDDLELAALARAVHTLVQLGAHARVHLDDGALLALLEDADSEVTGTRTDFEDDVGGLEVGLVDDVLRYEGVLENVLAEAVCVEDGVSGILTRGGR